MKTITQRSLLKHALVPHHVAPFVANTVSNDKRRILDPFLFCQIWVFCTFVETPAALILLDFTSLFSKSGILTTFAQNVEDFSL